LKSKEIGGTNPDTIRIRAHHLLCIQGFQGKGYSAEFVENMRQKIDFLKNNPSKRVQITDEWDEICASCPHLEKNICSESDGAENRIKNMDLMTMNVLGLECGQEYFFDNIQDKIIKNISLDNLKKICGPCSWNNTCLLYLNLK
jgi:uncharacterized protein